MKKVLSAIAMAMALAIVNATLAGVPQLINFQGKLTDENGDPLTGSYDLTFALWTHQTSTDISFCEWSETHTSVTVTDGLFNVILGSVNTVTLRAVFEVNDILYLEKTVGTETLTPRVQLGSAGFSLRAEGVSDEAITEDSLADDAVTASKLDVAAIDASGKIPELSSSTFTNLSGGNLTNLNASNITGGTIDSDRVEFGKYFIDSPGSPGQVWKSDGDEEGYWGTGTGGGGSLWAESESDIYYSAGNVGIGTTGPERLLHVARSATDGVNGDVLNSYEIAQFKVHGSGGSKRGLEIGAPTGSVISPVYLKVHGTVNRLAFLNQTNVETVTILAGGNVGIGDDSPDASLEIVGNFFVSQTDQADGNWFCVTGGNVGIGTCSPTERLEVEGSIAISQTVTANDFSGSAVSLTGLNAWNITTGTVDSDRVEFGEYFIDSPGSLGQVWKSDGDGRGQWETATEGGGSLWAESESDIYYSAGNVGIGTASPSEKLEVNGKVVIKDSVNIKGACGLMLSNSANDNFGTIYNTGGSGSAAIQFDTNVLGAMYIATAGNIGIGTTSPGVKLEVNGDVRVSADEAFIARYRANDDHRGLFQWQGLQLGNNSANYIVAGNTLAGGRLHFVVNNTNDLDGLPSGHNGIEALTILKSGNVGIGTTSPNALLHLKGGIAWTTYEDTADGIAGYVGDGKGVFSSGATDYLGVRGESGVHFGVSDSIKATIDSNGNLGIGTTNPAEKLTIASEGKIRFQDASNAYNNYLWADVWTANYRSGLIAESSASINYGLTGPDASRFAFRWLSHDNGAIEYSANTDELMCLTKAGNLGIGTTNPSQKLEVTGNIKLSEVTPGLKLNHTGSNAREVAIAADGTRSLVVNDDETDVFNIQYPSGNVGIGTDSPSKKLDVNGTAQVQSLWSQSTDISLFKGTLQVRNSYDLEGYSDNGATQKFLLDGAGGSSYILGKVGIGTTSPVSQLDLGSNNFRLSSGSYMGGPYICSDQHMYLVYDIDNDGGAFLISKGADPNDASPTIVLIVNNQGNVGIGTTSPSTILDVNGNFKVEENGSFRTTSNNNSWPVFKLEGTGDADLINVISDGAEVFTILDNGKVGIGTAWPGRKIDIQIDDETEYASSHIYSTSPASVFRVRNENADANYVGLDFKVRETAQARGYIDLVRTGASIGDFTFSLRNSGNVDEKMRIQANGNVGIGTTSPSAKLDVNGTAEINGTLDMKQNAVKNMVIETLAANPPSPVQGQIWLVQNP